MKLYFCTLFDSNYLPQGLALYHSLKRHCPDFRLFIFPFDDKSYKLLKELNLPEVELVPLEKFEDEKLLAVKPTRGRGEYCWTCSSSTILYVLKKFDVDHCTYLDADIFFFANPEILVREMGEKSILITEHRYAPENDQTAESGKYCVQFVTFKNNPEGLTALNWWRAVCLDWCYARAEDGKFGDQKYLDDWTEKFSGVHVLKHLGGGIAPWNVSQYAVENENNRLIGKKINSNEKFELIFYHFHSLKILSARRFKLHGRSYRISSEQKHLIYRPYLKELKNNISLAKKIDPDFRKIIPVFPRINGLFSRLKKIWSKK